MTPERLDQIEASLPLVELGWAYHDRICELIAEVRRCHKLFNEYELGGLSVHTPQEDLKRIIIPHDERG